MHKIQERNHDFLYIDIPKLKHNCAVIIDERNLVIPYWSFFNDQ